MAARWLCPQIHGSRDQWQLSTFRVRLRGLRNVPRGSAISFAYVLTSMVSVMAYVS